MPRDLGVFEEKPVVANIGRFGPYVLHDKKFISIPKGEDPYTVTPERAVELIQAKRELDANRLIKAFEGNADIQVLNGRFGPYIKAGKKNVKIPKGKVPEELTLEECVTLAENAPEKKGRWGRFGGGKKKEEVKVAPVKAARKPAPKKAATKKAAVKIPAKKVAAKKVKKK
jgi:DNA topoisomerase-1